jgi:hypothetical protein
MDALFEQVGGTIAAILDHPVVKITLLGIAFYVVVVWLATSFWALQDLRRRHRDPALPFIAAAGMILATPLLFPLAVVVYRIVRPGETLAEARERELADRLSALEAQDILSCPGCGEGVDEAWLACPGCRTRLSHQCVSCEQTMGLDWTVCAWCGSEFGELVLPETQPLARVPGAPPPVPEFRPRREVVRA